MKVWCDFCENEIEALYGEDALNAGFPPHGFPLEDAAVKTCHHCANERDLPYETYYAGRLRDGKVWYPSPDGGDMYMIPDKSIDVGKIDSVRDQVISRNKKLIEELKRR